MEQKMKKIVALTVSSLLGVSLLFLFNNCGQGFETMQDEVELSSSNPGGGGTTTPPIPGTPTVVTASQYFTNTVVPLFRTRCIACHVTLPRDAVGPPATDNIYKYTEAKAYALTGAVNSTNNTLYNKMLGLSHAGGNLCPGDVKGSVSPCKEVKTWIMMENPLLTDGIAGQINYVTSLGEVRGWAVDPTAAAAAIQVVVYADAAFDAGGTMVGTYTANGAGSGPENGHVFKFQLPANFANGARRPLFVYGKTAATVNLLPNTPFNYTAFAGTAAGAATFTNDVLPKLNQCMRCHNWSTRELTFPFLVSPTPLNGGTATNNTFINEAAGMGHSGGNFCGGGKTAEPCAAISRWWTDEGLGL